MTNNILITAKYSFITQIITVIIDYIALQTDIPSNLLILKQVLALELGVQIIEAIFYIWLLKSFHTKEEITKYRYYDWGLSTNVMLFTLIIYIVHLQHPTKTIIQIYQEHKKTIHNIIFLNTLMLIIGYLGEIKKIKINTSVIIGFIPFLIYYNIIYQSYVKDEILNKQTISNEKKKEIKTLFWYFFIIWSMYGIAAALPYSQKNVSYNILDLFSKNFFGLFLSYQVYKNRIYNK
jgi:hypothetical protein